MVLILDGAGGATVIHSATRTGAVVISYGIIYHHCRWIADTTNAAASLTGTIFGYDISSYNGYTGIGTKNTPPIITRCTIFGNNISLNGRWTPIAANTTAAIIVDAIPGNGIV